MFSLHLIRVVLHRHWLTRLHLLLLCGLHLHWLHLLRSTAAHHVRLRLLCATHSHLLRVLRLLHLSRTSHHHTGGLLGHAESGRLSRDLLLFAVFVFLALTLDRGLEAGEAAEAALDSPQDRLDHSEGAKQLGIFLVGHGV